MHQDPILLQVDSTAGGVLVSEIIGGKGRVTQINSSGTVVKIFQPATIVKTKAGYAVGQ